MIVVGSVNVDLSVTVPHLPGPGETVLGRRVLTGLGGKGTNVAVAGARLGAAVTLLACVGTDAFGDFALRALQSEALTLAMHRTPAPTGLALIGVTPWGENTVIVAPGANHDLAPEHLTPNLLRGQRLLVTQLEVPRATWQAALQLARSAGLQTVVNASPLTEGLGVADFQHVDVLLVNEHEAAALLRVSPLSGIPSAKLAAQTLALTTRAAVVTLGARGAVWATSSGSGHVPGQRVHVVDTTGAGDAFCGALCAALDDGLPLPEAVAWGNAAGAITATRAGTVAALPSRAELMTVLFNIGTP